jgi:hypothetical protein
VRSFIGSSLEGESTRDHLEYDYSQSPNVCRLAIIAFSLDDLGSDVAGSPAVVVENVVLFGELPAEAKVNELGFVLFVDEDVLHLDVSVHDVQSMAVGDGPRQTFNHEFCNFLPDRVETLRPHVVGQGPILQELSYNANRLLSLNAFQVGQN